MTRSVSTELELDPGSYSVYVRITATRYQKRPTVEEVVRMNCKNRQEKLLQIGMSYDLAHVKGLIKETEQEKMIKAEKEAKKEAETKEKTRGEAKKRKYKDWLRTKKLIERSRREKERLEIHKRKREERNREKEGAAQNSEAPKGESTAAKPAAEDDGAPSLTNKSLQIGEVVASLREPDAPTRDVHSPATSLKVDFNSSQRKNTDNPADTLKERSSSNGKSTPPTETPVTGPERSPQTLTQAPQQITSDGNMTAQEKIEQLTGNPSLVNPGAPAVKVTRQEDGNPVLPTPPSSPGYPGQGARSGQPPSEPDTIVTYATSIDSELDQRYFEDDNGSGRFQDGSMIIAEGESESEDEDFEEYSSDPWNAVCVIGLRIYTKKGEASIKVVRPPLEEDDKEKEAPLDVDDPMRSLSDEPVTPSSPLKGRKPEPQMSKSEQLTVQIPRSEPTDGKASVDTPAAG